MGLIADKLQKTSYLEQKYRLSKVKPENEREKKNIMNRTSESSVELQAAQYMLFESPKEEKGEMKKIFEIMPPIFLTISENYKLTDEKTLMYSKYK